jgi:hypothetical protein
MEHMDAAAFDAAFDELSTSYSAHPLSLVICKIDRTLYFST